MSEKTYNKNLKYFIFWFTFFYSLISFIHITISINLLHNKSPGDFEYLILFLSNLPLDIALTSCIILIMYIKIIRDKLIFVNISDTKSVKLNDLKKLQFQIIEKCLKCEQNIKESEKVSIEFEMTVNDDLRGDINKIHILHTHKCPPIQPAKQLLFVSKNNLDRVKTAADLFSGEHKTKYILISDSYNKKVEENLNWCEIVFTLNSVQEELLRKNYLEHCGEKFIFNLNIPGAILENENDFILSVRKKVDNILK